MHSFKTSQTKLTDVNKKKKKKVMSSHFAIEDITKFNVIMKLKNELNEMMTHWQITPPATDTSSHLVLRVLSLEVQELQEDSTWLYGSRVGLV
jgi:hypothetical protein